MTTRELDLVRAYLAALKSFGDRATLEVHLHAAMHIAMSVRPTLAEFEDARDRAETKGWARAARDAAERNCWSLTPEGRNALADLR